MRDYANFQYKFKTNRSLAINELFDGRSEMGDKC